MTYPKISYEEAQKMYPEISYKLHSPYPDYVPQLAKEQPKERRAYYVQVWEGSRVDVSIPFEVGPYLTLQKAREVKNSYIGKPYVQVIQIYNVIEVQEIDVYEVDGRIIKKERWVIKEDTDWEDVESWERPEMYPDVYPKISYKLSRLQYPEVKYVPAIAKGQIVYIKDLYTGKYTEPAIFIGRTVEYRLGSMRWKEQVLKDPETGVEFTLPYRKIRTESELSQRLPDFLPALEGEERKIDIVLRQLKSGVENLQDSAQYRLFLTTMSKFHAYSIGNLVLIAMQKPNATRVAGFVTWKNLGRWVKRGEEGIRILAPVFPPKPKKEEMEEEVEEIEIEPTPINFKVVNVFDISQTEGKPLPEFVIPILTGEANEELFARTLALGKAQGLEVSFESRPTLDPSLKGSLVGKTIWVRPEEPRAQQLKTLLHELAHYFTEFVFRIPAAVAEVMAESIAYVVGAHFGFDTGTRSFPYIVWWSKDKKILAANLGSIRKISERMIGELEKSPLQPSTKKGCSRTSEALTNGGK